MITIMQMTAATINDMVHLIHIQRDYKNSLADMLYLQGRKHLFNDVWNDMMVNILEYKDQGSLLKMYNRDNFFPWWIRMCANNVKSKTSPVFYKYVKPALHQMELNEYHRTKTFDYEKLIDDNNKIEALKRFIDESELISREHKISLICFKHYYFEQLTIQDIAKKYKSGEIKMSQSKIFTSIKFAEQFVKANFDFNKYKD